MNTHVEAYPLKSHYLANIFNQINSIVTQTSDDTIHPITHIDTLNRIHKRESSNQRFQQKSVTSLQTVIISNKVPRNHFFNKTQKIRHSFDNAFKLNRFHYISLPQNTTLQFQKFLSEDSTSDIDKISDYIETTVLPIIKSEANSTINLQTRQSQMNEYRQKVTFAEIKGKSKALTQAELDYILNSTYLYLPYIEYSNTKIVDNPKNKLTGKKIITTLRGGVYWFHIDFTRSKVLPVGFSKEVTVESRHEIKLFKDKTHKHHSNDKIKQSIYDSERKAFNQLIYELKLKTRQIDAFKLTDQIINRNQNQYNIRIGKREKLRLDDTFYIYEWALTNTNSFKATRVGYGYIRSVGDPDSSSHQQSLLYQQLGELQSIGGWIEEDAKRKISISFKPFMASNLSIPKDSLSVNVDGTDLYLLKKTYNQAIGLSVGLSYNIAELTQISQLYVDLMTSASFLSQSKINDHQTNQRYESIPLLYSVYIAARKKIWFYNNAIVIRPGIGLDAIYFMTTQDRIKNINVSTIGTGLLLGYERLLTPNTSIFFHFEKKWSLSTAMIRYTYDNDELLSYKSLPELKLGGEVFSVGVELHF
jgi:hypothetical protein